MCARVLAARALIWLLPFSLSRVMSIPVAGGWLAYLRLGSVVHRVGGRWRGSAGVVSRSRLGSEPQPERRLNHGLNLCTLGLYSFAQFAILPPRGGVVYGLWSVTLYFMPFV